MHSECCAWVTGVFGLLVSLCTICATFAFWIWLHVQCLSLNETIPKIVAFMALEFISLLAILHLFANIVSILMKKSNDRSQSIRTLFIESDLAIPCTIAAFCVVITSFAYLVFRLNYWALQQHYLYVSYTQRLYDDAIVWTCIEICLAPAFFAVGYCLWFVCVSTKSVKKHNEETALLSQ